MSRSAQAFDDAGTGKRWGASVAGSLVLHAAAVAALAGVVYDVSSRPQPVPTVRDISMTLRSGSVDSFVRAAPSAVTPLSLLLRDPSLVSAEVGSTNGPSLADVMKQLQTQTIGVSALGVLSTSSNSALAGAIAGPNTDAGSPALGPNAQPTGGGSAVSSVVFAGLSATGDRAKSVVYVVDGSGPMVSSLPDVFAEVMRSVDALQPTQQFGVVLFRQSGESRLLTFDSVLRDATAANRTKLRVWLTSLNAGGRSNPLDGLRAGLAMRPQAVFLLSRSIPRAAGNPWEAEAGGPDAILRELEALNPAGPGGARPTLIKTLQFIEPDPTGVMERIGRMHGGTGASTPPFRVLRREEISRR
ncbi:hypothetical protein [Synechococcus sp. Cruz CV-v-12]|uniref:hypothetical protein n=1 Tax=Synechococcus sp. Cruz CV-v-12 TaxID=2823728 RepID=UPI0020CC16F9|nr:hypothetical protein [Synechococcus sp. Cruz CV-v-12]MCP9874821.1 hypothetical protein [Synechococcus sp. Cruz CV-v-12]